MIVGVAAASAAFTHVGQITEANGKPLSQPWGMAFDASGNLFAADTEKAVVDLFDSSNTFVSEIGAGDFSSEFKYMRDVSVNETTGVLYVAESGLEELLVYEPLGGGVYELVQNVSLEGEGFLYVAVDNSGGAHEGDVYVTAQLGETAHVYIFETNVKGELGAKEELTPPEGGFSLINQDNGDGGVAVNGTNGDVYLPETEHGVVTVYGPEGSLLKTVDGTETPDESFEPIGVAIDESTGEFYVIDEAHKVVDQFTSAGAYVDQIKGFSSEPLGVAVQNLAGPSHGFIYVSNGTKIDIYEGEPIGPVTFPLSVEKTGTGEGTVTSTPAGIDCGGECSAEFEAGSEVTLTASAESGTFTGWSGGGCSGSGECKVTMNEALTVEAAFTVPPTNTGKPAISGAAQAGHTLKTTDGTWGRRPDLVHLPVGGLQSGGRRMLGKSKERPKPNTRSPKPTSARRCGCWSRRTTLAVPPPRPNPNRQPKSRPQRRPKLTLKSKAKCRSRRAWKRNAPPCISVNSSRVWRTRTPTPARSR